MPKIVILGRRKDLEPLDIIYIPETDPNGLESAQKRCWDAINQADEVWVNLPIGEHTLQDVEYAEQQGKYVRFIKNPEAGPFDAVKRERSSYGGHPL